jgi:hypothetical protein
MAMPSMEWSRKGYFIVLANTEEEKMVLAAAN